MRHRSVPVSEILAHPTKSLRAKDYLPDEVAVSLLRLETCYVMVTEESPLFNPKRTVMVPRSLLKRYQKHTEERASLMAKLKGYYEKQEE